MQTLTPVMPSSSLGLLDHHLLGHPNLLHGDLHAEIAAGHHDAIGLRKDPGSQMSKPKDRKDSLNHSPGPSKLGCRLLEVPRRRKDSRVVCWCARSVKLA